MMILLGDMVTVRREHGGDVTFVSGRVTGLVQNDSGDLERFHIKGLGNALWVNEGWKFEEVEEYEMEEEE
jgi:hypothetical protein